MGKLNQISRTYTFKLVILQTPIDSNISNFQKIDNGKNRLIPLLWSNTTSSFLIISPN